MTFDHYSDGVAYNADSSFVYTKRLAPTDSAQGWDWDEGFWDTNTWDAT